MSQYLAPSGTSSRDNLRQPTIVPVAVDTVELCTHDDGRVCRPKHVEWTKQRNKIHCIQLHLLVISIEYYDARNNEYILKKKVTNLT